MLDTDFSETLTLCDERSGERILLLFLRKTRFGLNDLLELVKSSTELPECF